MINIRIFRIQFKLPITFREISYFRGAVIQAINKDDVLFHNHVDDGFRYKYPLIQYKRIAGNAAVLFIGEGTDKSINLLKRDSIEAQIGKRRVMLEVERVEATQSVVQLWNDEQTYSIRKYLSLNQQNYDEYQRMEGLVDRYRMLEKVLVGNILSFAKGINLHFDERVTVNILHVSDPREYHFKDVKMMGFDLIFKSNVSLPDYIGLGKGVSIGFGMVKRFQKQNNK